MSLDEKPNFSRRSSPEKRRKSRDENCAKSLWREAIARDWSAPEHKGIGSISLIISWLSVACRIHEPLHIWGSAVDRMRKSTRLCTQSLVLCMCIKYLTSKASKATSMFYHAAVTEPLVRDFIVVEVSSPTCKKGSCSIIQLFSRPKVSKSRMILQEPFLQRGWTLTKRALRRDAPFVRGSFVPLKAAAQPVAGSGERSGAAVIWRTMMKEGVAFCVTRVNCNLCVTAKPSVFFLWENHFLWDLSEQRSSPVLSPFFGKEDVSFLFVPSERGGRHGTEDASKVLWKARVSGKCCRESWRWRSCNSPAVHPSSHFVTQSGRLLSGAKHA